MKLTKKEKYALSQFKKAKKESIEFDIEEDILKELDNICKDLKISRDEFFHLMISSFVLDKNKEELKNKYPNENVIDMYDFYKLEEFMKTKELYFVATSTKPVVLVPIKDYKDLTK